MLVTCIEHSKDQTGNKRQDDGIHGTFQVVCSLDMRSIVSRLVWGIQESEQCVERRQPLLVLIFNFKIV